MSLQDHARASGSSAVVVTKAGVPVIDWVDDQGHRPIETMSVTKMVVGAVIAASLGQAGPEVLDTSITTWLSEWKNDQRAAVTLRTLLNHQSGLRSIPAPEANAIPDAFVGALSLPMERAPRQGFVYNNLAFNLLGGIVQRAFGASIAEVANQLLFTPIGFGDWNWRTDEAGNPRCHWGLMCRADDLAKVGGLFLDGRDILPQWWLTEAIDSGLSCYPQNAWIRASISSHLVERWRLGGIDEDLIARLGDLVDHEMEFDHLWAELQRRFDGEAHVLFNEVATRGLPRFDRSSGPVVAYGHDGDGGQYLLIFPDSGAVAVRKREDINTGSIWSSFPGDAHAAIEDVHSD